MHRMAAPVGCSQLEVHKSSQVHLERACSGVNVQVGGAGGQSSDGGRAGGEIKGGGEGWGDGGGDGGGEAEGGAVGWLEAAGAEGGTRSDSQDTLLG